MEARKETFRVRTYECGADGSMKLHSLMQQLQEVAAAHAEELGFGPAAMRKIGGYWALSNLRMEIDKMPRWNEHVAIKTWPSGYGRLMATREFVGKDRSEAEFFRASSEWMILERKKARPKNLMRLDRKLPAGQVKAIPAELQRLQSREGYSRAGQIRVPYSSIDLNGHVNNTEYVRWGMDALRRTIEFVGEIRRLHVTYLAEVFEGDEVDILDCRTGAGQLNVIGTKANSDVAVFLMEISCR